MNDDDVKELQKDIKELKEDMRELRMLIIKGLYTPNPRIFKKPDNEDENK